MTDLKLNPRIKPSPFTGSAFDATLTGGIHERPGGHPSGPSIEINVNAFSHCKKTNKPDPNEFIKRGTGLGGTVTVRSIKFSSFLYFSSILTFLFFLFFLDCKTNFT